MIWHLYWLKVHLCPSKIRGNTSDSCSFFYVTSFFHFIYPPPESPFDYGCHWPFCIHCHILLCMMTSWYLVFHVCTEDFLPCETSVSLILYFEIIKLSFGAKFSLSVWSISDHRSPVFSLRFLLSHLCRAMSVFLTHRYTGYSNDSKRRIFETVACIELQALKMKVIEQQNK